MHASSSNKIDVVRLLIEKGANKNEKNNKGKSALNYASDKNNNEIIDLLK